MVANELEGVAELTRKLRDLRDPRATARVLKAAVATPMNKVKRDAQANIRAISPGKRLLHRTYKGRLVTAGFAARSLRVVTTISRDKTRIISRLGVRREAFYALQFFELGTAHIPAHPWLVPAFESSKERTLKQIGITMRKRIESIAAKRAASGVT